MAYFFKKLGNILIGLLILFVAALSIGCKEMDPNPELKDPIYKDLKNIADKLKKEVEAKEKELPKLVEAVKKEKVRTLPLKLARRKVTEAKIALRKLRQDAHYAKIRAEKRKVLGRRQYKVAFQKGETWPDPEDFKRYKTNKRLRAADLNWNKRVPKLQSANPNFSGQKKQEKPKE